MHTLKIPQNMLSLYVNKQLHLTHSSLTLHCHLHPLQAANCYCNSRLVVDEDDFMWMKK